MTHSDNQLDQLLQAAGESWRSSQPNVHDLGVATLIRQRGQSRSISLIGPIGALGAIALATVGLIAVFVAGPLGSRAPITPTVPPNASPTTSGWPNNFYLENRGGPPFTVAINGTAVITVGCDGGLTLAPGVDNVPQLPWDLAITRTADDSTLLAQSVAALPRWFVQIGNEPLGLSNMPVQGPMGPTCAPASPPPSQRASCSESEASQLTLIQAVNEDQINFGGVYIDDNGVLVIQYVGENAGRAAIEQKIGCAEAVQWEKVQRSRADLDRIMNEIGDRVQSGVDQALSGVFAIELDTINNQIVVWVGPGSSMADAARVLSADYFDAVRVKFTSDPPVVH